MPFAELVWMEMLKLRLPLTRRGLFNNQVIMHGANSPVMSERAKHIELDCPYYMVESK